VEGRLALSVVVPVGATATVHLPGAREPVHVGHGHHRFEALDPYADEPALPARPTVRDVLDHEPTWSAVTAAALEIGIAGAEQEVARRLERYLDAPASDLADALAPGGFVPGADAFRERADRIFRLAEADANVKSDRRTS
jgi:alpha-L-rhamnosidase